MELKSEFRVNLTFSKFTRYFIPGWFGAFWLFFYIIRFTHPQLITADQLMSHFYTQWDSIIVVILTLGGFLGICLVGLHSLIYAFIGSRMIDHILKYLLSSKIFRHIAFIGFMRFREMRESFLRLPAEIVRSSTQCRTRLGRIVDGPLPSKCFLREVLQNNFWYDLIDRDTRGELTVTEDFSSMFFYLSSISFFFFFQLLLFISNTFDVEGLLSYIRQITNVELSFGSEILLLALIIFVIFNFLVNISVRPRWRLGVRWEESLWEILVYIIVGLFLGFGMWVIVHPVILMEIAWFSFVDPFILAFLFVLSVSMYWAGAFEYSRYLINYDRYFHKNRQETISYILENTQRIKSTHDKIFPELAQGEQSEQPLRCSNCDSLLTRILVCPNCGSKFCLVCALNLKICPNCDVHLMESRT